MCVLWKKHLFLHTTSCPATPGGKFCLTNYIYEINYFLSDENKSARAGLASSIYIFFCLVGDGKLVRGKCVPALEGGGEFPEYKQGWWF